MVRYLSDEWLHELDLVGATCAPPGADLPNETFVVQQVVGDGSEERAYHLILGPDGIRVRADRADEPDCTFSTDREVAADIARGDRHAQQELTSGRLRVTGETSRLAQWSELLRSFDEAAGQVRSSTEY